MMPGRSVLDAFGVEGTPRRLEGGRGAAWRAGSLVLKPLDVLPQELEWLDARAEGRNEASPLRLSLPVRSRGGNLIEDGWVAYGHLEGSHEVGTWLDLAAVARAFSGLFAGEPRPAFLDEREHAWAEADRFAWGESDVAYLGGVPYMARLAAARVPVGGAACIIHGDLTGNVLFSAGEAPAVIDLTVYYRPVPYAIAIIAVDAVCFEGAPLALLESVSPDEDFPQYLLRALLFRIVTDALRGRPAPSFGVYRRAVERVLELAASSPGTSAALSAQSGRERG
ncbi:aminoglycoside phosphotransferase/kinase family protein [Arthrobacter sp. TMN-37]